MRLKLRPPVSPPVGAIMIMSPLLVRSIRHSRFAWQNSKKSSSLSLINRGAKFRVKGALSPGFIAVTMTLLYLNLRGLLNAPRVCHCDAIVSQSRVVKSLNVRAIIIASQKNPAHTKTHVSRELQRTCMKYKTTSVALITAIVSATTTFRIPRSAFATLHVTTVNTPRVAKTAKYTFGETICSLILSSINEDGRLSNTRAGTGKSTRCPQNASTAPTARRANDTRA